MSSEDKGNKDNVTSNKSFYAEEAIAALRGSVRSGGINLGVTARLSGYAELFETIDGKTIQCGYFVTLDGNKIRKATSKDKFILGVTSAAPAILGTGNDVRWKDKYVTDEWGSIQYDEVDIPAVLDEDGVIIIPEHKEQQPRINPQWDKDKRYLPRTLREEWVAVTLLGQVLIRDDGTCQVNANCIPNDNGVATASQRGYRVLERRTPNQILILIRANTINLGIKKE